MAKTGDRNDPFITFRFKVKIGDMAVAGFSECSGLQLETEVHEYQEGGNNRFVHKFPTRAKQSNLTFKRGIVDKEIWNWYYEFIQGKQSIKSGNITVADSLVKKEMVWEFQNAFPVKISGPELNASQNNVAVETLELCHQGLTLKIKDI